MHTCTYGMYMIHNSVRYVVVHTVSNPCMSNSVNFTWEGYIECWGRPGHKLVDVQQMTVACTCITQERTYMYLQLVDKICNSIHVSVIQSLVAWCPGTKKAVRG